jgi:hypothetical protein
VGVEETHEHVCPKIEKKKEKVVHDDGNCGEGNE